MYTIKIKQVGEPARRISSGVRQEIEGLLNTKLNEAGLQCEGLYKFMGRRDYLTLGAFSNISIDKNTGNNTITDHQDWVIINKAINETLDELKVDAQVRAERYIVRNYTKRTD